MVVRSIGYKGIEGSAKNSQMVMMIRNVSKTTTRVALVVWR